MNKEGETIMSDTNETRGAIKPENGHGAGSNERPVYGRGEAASEALVSSGEDFGAEGNTSAPALSHKERMDRISERLGVDESEPDEDEQAPDDDEVPDGTVLEPGYHVFEVATATPCKQDILLAGLTRLGISNVRLDQSRARSAAQLPVREHRFLANVTKRLELHQPGAPGAPNGGGGVRWLFAEALDTDITKDVRSFRMKLEAYDLEPSMLYESLFLSRERSQPTRQIVEEHLNEMGFMIHTLTCIQKDLRLADRPGVSVALWFALLEWDAPASVVTEDDPFYFESLITRS